MYVVLRREKKEVWYGGEKQNLVNNVSRLSGSSVEILGLHLW